MTRQRFTATLFGVVSIFALCGICCNAQQQETPRVASEHRAGDAPPDPGPLATDLSPAFKPAAIHAAMRKVADWQSARVADFPSQDWTFATLYVGLLSASETLHEPRYRDQGRDFCASGGALS